MDRNNCYSIPDEIFINLEATRTCTSANSIKQNNYSFYISINKYLKAPAFVSI